MIKSELTKQERERRLKILKQGIRGEFWQLVRAELLDLIESEHAYMNAFKKSGIDPKELDKFNRSSVKLEALKELVNIPELAISNTETWLQKINRKATDFIVKTPSFMGAYKNGKV